MKHKLLMFIFILAISTQVAYSQNDALLNDTLLIDDISIGVKPTKVDLPEEEVVEIVEEGAFSRFLSYMRGRSKIGFNFAPCISLNALSSTANSLVKLDSVHSVLARVLPHAEDSDEYVLTQEFHVNAVAKTFGFSLYYDFTVLPFMSVSAAVGFANVGMGLEQIQYLDYVDNTPTDIGISTYDFYHRTLSYSLGVKFFPSKQAPWGFYVMPKLGGLYVEATGRLTIGVGMEDSFDISMLYASSYGFYASVELGYNWQLFPNKTKDWPVEIGIDVGFIDLGYYFVPWSTKILENSIVTAVVNDDVLEKYSWLSNIQALILPRLAFTVKF